MGLLVVEELGAKVVGGPRLWGKFHHSWNLGAIDLWSSRVGTGRTASTMASLMATVTSPLTLTVAWPT